ncbi:MAG: hypothetical protein C5B60_09435 [Chloroflexi bacterium]|nr:MAG: hypothetical protein C5B60_09435 [Chloroflexota bacterium]
MGLELDSTATQHTGDGVPLFSGWLSIAHDPTIAKFSHPGRAYDKHRQIYETMIPYYLPGSYNMLLFSWHLLYFGTVPHACDFMLN